MKYRIGRNDLCPCGSGKKYKKCCFGKEGGSEFSDVKDFPSLYKKLRKAAQFKECIYPDHSCCSERIIHAHSIQNNKILARIADNGMVFMPTVKPELTFSLQNEYGRKEASVFTGFCGYHDKRVFQPIEDCSFKGTEEQVFLYIYRAFALEYHRNQEAVRMQQEAFSYMPSHINPAIYTIQGKTGFQMAVMDYSEEKTVFDEALLTSEYNILTSFVWVFDGYAHFAATGAEAPSLDFDSKKIQDLKNPNIPVRHIYMSVFPENDKTYVIIAWLKKYDEVFSSIGKKLERLNEIEKRNYVNNTLPFITENIAIKPSSWNDLSKQAKEEFAMLFYELPELIEFDGKKFDRFQSPSFDLFSL